MNEEALKQAKKLYADLLAKFNESPIKVALAFGFINEESTITDRKKACARVGMWKTVGVPKKYEEKAKELID